MIKDKIMKYINPVLDKLDDMYTDEKINDYFLLYIRVKEEIKYHLPKLVVVMFFIPVICASYHLNTIYSTSDDTQDIVESYYTVAPTIVLSESVRNEISDKTLKYIELLENYDVPLSPVPYVTNYTHYTLVREDIDEAYKKNSKAVLDEVESIRKHLEHIWVLAGIKVPVTLEVLANQSDDRVILTVESDSIVSSYDPQINHIEGDEESYKVYMEYLNLKKVDNLSGDN